MDKKNKMRAELHRLMRRKEVIYKEAQRKAKKYVQKKKEKLFMESL